MIRPVKKESSQIVPIIHPTQSFVAMPYKKSSCSTQFDISNSRFACLASKDELTTLRPNCVEIDISRELAVMNKESALEVTVPVLGLTDLLGASPYSNKSRQFPCPIALNGFGAKLNNVTVNNFPHAEFVLITDIMGNQFEIIVNQDGKIEIPKDGTGLFSIIAAITFIFNEDQVKQGAGFENLQCCGLKENKLLLLLPEESNEKFTVNVCVTHINEYHHRIVDTIRTINTQYPEMTKKDYRTNVVVQRTNDAIGLLSVNLALMLLLPLAKHLPLTASIALLHPDGVKYGFHHPEGFVSLPTKFHGWMQDPVHSNIFTKHIGLSDKTLNLLVRNLYSEYDFMKDYLKGDTFTLSHKNGYNNFLLRPEGFGHFYDLVVHDLVHQKIPASFLFDRVPDERLAELDLSHLPVNLHDSIVLSHIQDSISEHDFQYIKRLFLSNDLQHNIMFDEFNVFASQPMATLPQVAVDLSHEDSFFHDSNIDVLLTQDQYANQPYQTFDLHQMLEAQASWTPMMTVAQEVGNVVTMTFTEENGEKFNVTTHVQVDPEPFKSGQNLD